MSLINYDPFATDIDRAFDTWSRRMERLFRPFEQPLITSTTAALPSTAWSSASSRVLLPPVDLIDREKELIVQTELPGMDKKDIKVEVQGDQLVVHGESRKESKYESENFVRRERTTGQFRRSVTLPRECDQQNIQAKFENGLLEVHIPKRAIEGQAQRKTITVA